MPTLWIGTLMHSVEPKVRDYIDALLEELADYKEGCKGLKETAQDFRNQRDALLAENAKLRRLLKEAQCPDILHCDKGWITNSFNNRKSPCAWCEKREQALSQAEKPDNSQFKEAADVLDKALNDIDPDYEQARADQS